VVVRVKQHQQPEVLPFDTVKEGILVQLQQEKAAEKASEEGERLLNALRYGAPAESQWKTTEAASRNQEGVEPAVLQQVFRMRRPESRDKPCYGSVRLGYGGFVVIRLDGVSEPNVELSAQDKQSYRRFLASRSGQQDFAAYLEMQHAEAKIETF